MCLKTKVLRTVYELICIVILQGVVVVYDITSEDSFASLTKWIEDITEVSDGIL